MSRSQHQTFAPQPAAFSDGLVGSARITMQVEGTREVDRALPRQTSIAALLEQAHAGHRCCWVGVNVNPNHGALTLSKRAKPRQEAIPIKRESDPADLPLSRLALARTNRCGDGVSLRAALIDHKRPNVAVKEEKTGLKYLRNRSLETRSVRQTRAHKLIFDSVDESMRTYDLRGFQVISRASAAIFSAQDSTCQVSKSLVS